MKNQYHYIIDQSGSMSNCQRATIEGINVQINSLRKLAVEEKELSFKASVHFFNDNVKTVSKEQLPMNLRNLTPEDYSPNGNTSLYDAIGCIGSAERLMSAADVKQGKKKVVFVILTDGYENSSKLFTFESVRKLISEMQEEGYVFLFLGAIIDAKEVAEKMNIKKENAHSFSKDQMKGTFSKMSSSLEDLAKKKSNWNKFN